VLNARFTCALETDLLGFTLVEKGENALESPAKSLGRTGTLTLKILMAKCCKFKVRKALTWKIANFLKKFCFRYR
jgi:hypothetical protein